MALLGSSSTMQGQALKLKYRTASEHGFFVLRDPAGAIIASGEATQVASKGPHLASRGFPFSRWIDR